MSSDRSDQLGQFRSARLGLTTCDLQLRKVITSSSELRFGCSWTLWKAHLVKNLDIYIMIKVELILGPKIMKKIKHMW